ncbi:MAG: HTH-type transcriptional repressor FabR [bacterium]|nr:HTH-type transcriptional repressor FabR [bacterium]
MRIERKLHTRQALLDAALGLMGEGRGFGALSLREVARAAHVVPTAFYRHFRDMDELGLTLVDETFLTLRRLMREARQAARSGHDMRTESVRVYVGFVREHRRVFEFVVRERHGGTPSVRMQIAREIRFITQDLADDLSALPALRHLDRSARETVAHLIVGAVATMTGELLDLPPGPGAEEAERALAERAVAQLTVVMRGAATLGTPP